MWWSLRAQDPRLFMARYTAMATRMPPNHTSSCRHHGLFICRHRHRVWSIRLLPHGWCTTQRPRRCCTGHLFMSVLSIGLHHSGVQNTLSKWARAGTVKLGMGENAERVSVAMVVMNANASHGVVKRSDLTPQVHSLWRSTISSRRISTSKCLKKACPNSACCGSRPLRPTATLVSLSTKLPTRTGTLRTT